MSRIDGLFRIVKQADHSAFGHIVGELEPEAAEA